MPDSESDTTDAPIASKLQEMRSGDDPSTPAAVEDSPYAMATLPSEGASWGSKGMGTGTSQPSAKSKSNSTTSTPSSNDEEILGGDITVKLEPGEAPKLSRTASQKVPAKPRQLFSDSPDKTDEALGTFDVLPQCSYVPKYLGESEPALDCDCTEEWHPTHGVNFACGEDSDCINRATKMECAMDCGCGSNCQNQRFQRRQYAKVSVIKTEKKGFGLRAETALRPSDFVFEYIGEVINEAAFRKRMIQYDEEGIKHFYFMSLNKGEFIDATKKGNLGRFCNHSCNPNCYVDKWVVGDKLRMGIFAQRHIEAGEELVFNYNVDRYGADPQPCYCGEPNCTGFIGGKTQTERATKLSNITIEALGIDDGEGWDVAVAKRPRKKKSSEDDEEYVNNIQPKPLQEAGVTRVMAALRQCKDKWIAVKLLDRIQKSQDSKVMDRVVRMHGYQILKSTLSTWIDDHNVVVQVLDILDTLPRITRNKIQDSKIEDTIQKLVHCGEDRVEVRAKSLLDVWSKLEVGYRIPRVKRDPNAKPAKSERSERRDTSARPNSRSRSRSKTPPKGPAAGVPSGPRGYNGPKFNGPHRMPYRRPHQNLPAGWSSAVSAEGRTYYYNATGERTWVRPTAPIQQAPPPPKEKTNEEKLQDIIRSITENPVLRDKQPSSATTPVSAPEPKKEKNEKWRRYTQEKQMKIYENTLFPHIKHVMNKFTHKLPRDDLKRFAKEVSKKLVESDYKKGRVSDPTIITDKQASAVKRYTQDYLEKAVRKKIEHDKKKASQNQDKAAASASPASASSFSPGNKRKREESLLDGTPLEDDNPEDMSNFKKIKSEPDTPSPPPPPPPPPPADDMDELVDQEGEDGDDPMDESGLSPAGDEDDEPVAFPGVSSKLVDHHVVPSPQQLATPPTTTNGSCENDVESSMEDK